MKLTRWVQRAAGIAAAAGLVVTVVLVPHAGQRALAAASPASGTVSIQCPSFFGNVPAPLSVTTTTAGTTSASTASTVQAISCNYVSSQAASSTGATTSVAVCGFADGYTAPSGGTAGSLTIDGITIPIPASYTPPDYLAKGAVVYVVFLLPGLQLVEISPGVCTPLAAARPDAGASAIRAGRLFAD